MGEEAGGPVPVHGPGEGAEGEEEVEDGDAGEEPPGAGLLHLPRGQGREGDEVGDAEGGHVHQLQQHHDQRRRLHLECFDAIKMLWATIKRAWKVESRDYWQ